MPPLFRRILYALLCSAAVCALCVYGPLYTLDNTASDAFYQRRGMPDENIIVIGMDEEALEALGPMPWPREVFARVIENLNSDPDNRPSVIGIDVQFTGESLADANGDEALAQACARYGNVVTVSAGIIGSGAAADDGAWHLDTGVLGWEEPYGALLEHVETGHGNAVLDGDGILRHALLYLEKPDGETAPSFPCVIYEKYCRENGLTPSEPESLQILSGLSHETVSAQDAQKSWELQREVSGEAGVWYIPFVTEHGGYEDSFTFLKCLEGPVSSRRLAGKIVLIGPYAPGMQDEYFTSISHDRTMFGVEIQANLIDAFLNGRNVREAGREIQIPALFLLAFLTAFALWDRRTLPSVLIWPGVCGLWAAACSYFYQNGVILHILWVPAAVTAEFAVSVLWNYSRTRRAKKKVEQTFGRYVDHAIIKDLMENDAAADLGGKLVDIAVLFVDIRGFTTMSESLSPTVVVEIINRYLSLTTDCIMKNHGTLDKFVGDCTMAIWNAPVRVDDPTGLACRAAMDMVKGSAALGEELERQFGRTVDFGIGVHYGPAVVGNIGASRRMDYTAIGDTVNTAARLEANAKGGQILISRAVKEMLGDRARTTSLGNSIKLKGKSEGFEIFTLDKLL